MSTPEHYAINSVALENLTVGMNQILKLHNEAGQSLMSKDWGTFEEKMRLISMLSRQSVEIIINGHRPAQL